MNFAYVLMHDSKGWQSLAPGTFSQEYMRLAANTLPDIEVKKGALVDIDPNCDFDPAINTSVVGNVHYNRQSLYSLIINCSH